MRFVFIGLVVGPAAAVLASRLIEGLLFGVKPTDPATYVDVAAVVCLVGLTACVVPIRRALRAAPIRSLKAE